MTKREQGGKLKMFAIYLAVFILGCGAVVLPFYLSAQSLNDAELARGEQTMGPGWTMFSGLVFAPAGGMVAISVAWLALRYRSKYHHPN